MQIPITGNILMYQHKIPKLSLKHFQDNNGRIWTYCKSTGKHWAKSPDATGGETHFYSIQREDGTMDTQLEELFSKVESDVAGIYEDLAQGKKPQGSNRDIFGCFLGLMFVRSPSMRRMNAEIAKLMIEESLKATAEFPKAFEKLLKDLEINGVDISDPESIRSSITDLSDYDLILPKSYTLKALENLETFSKIFLSMKWSILKAEQHYFITSDSPINNTIAPKTRHPFYGNGGLLNQTSEITFPITRKRALLMHWGDFSIDEISLSRDQVKHENFKRVSGAEKEVYAHLKHKNLLKLVTKYKKTKNKVFKVGRKSGKGFGDVIVPRKWSD